MSYVKLYSVNTNLNKSNAKYMTKAFLNLTAFCVLLFSTTIGFTDTKSIVRIGATIPLTGPLAEIGVEIQHGFEMALESESAKQLPIQLRYF